MPYQIDVFVDACANPKDVSVAYDAKKDAEQFNLLTETAILDFINSGGLEDYAYINTAVWHLNPHKPPDIDVDAYSFYSGERYGYMAFMFIPRTGKWRIKSFKLNTNPNPREIKNDFRHLAYGKLIQITDKALKGV